MQWEKKADELADHGRDRRGGLVGEALMDLVARVKGVDGDEIEPDIRVSKDVCAIECEEKEGDDHPDQGQERESSRESGWIGKRFNAGEVCDGGDVNGDAEGGEKGEDRKR